MSFSRLTEFLKIIKIQFAFVRKIVSSEFLYISCIRKTIDKPLTCCMQQVASRPIRRQSSWKDSLQIYCNTDCFLRSPRTVVPIGLCSQLKSISWRHRNLLEARAVNCAGADSVTLDRIINNKNKRGRTTKKCGQAAINKVRISNETINLFPKRARNRGNSNSAYGSFAFAFG